MPTAIQAFVRRPTGEDRSKATSLVPLAQQDTLPIRKAAIGPAMSAPITEIAAKGG